MIPFVKYQGTGNDFILIDGRHIDYSSLDVQTMCHRNFGIGADGLMILKKKEGYDFEMVYFNSDGNLSSMCGNGGRCIAHWAFRLGLKKKNETLTFWAPDGMHSAMMINNDIHLTMNNVSKIERINPTTVELNTGSPHYVEFFDTKIDSMNFVNYGKSIRYNSTYQEVGINVNAVEILGENSIYMRTYERGVENETLSCGTGVTAAALSYSLLYQPFSSERKIEVNVTTAGGKLQVRAIQTSPQSFTNIELCGSAQMVFEGLY